MINLKDLTTAQLQWALDIRKHIEDLESQLDSIQGGTGRGPGRPKKVQEIKDRASELFDDAFPRARFQIKRKRRMSAAGRRAIAAGVKKRWAKLRGKKSTKPVKKQRKMSAAAKAKISAAAKARWKLAKAQGKTTL